MKRPVNGPDTGREPAHRSNLTPHQLVMWLAHELYPGVPLHNLAVTFTLNAPDRGRSVSGGPSRPWSNRATRSAR